MGLIPATAVHNPELQVYRSLLDHNVAGSPIFCVLFAIICSQNKRFDFETENYINKIAILNSTFIFSILEFTLVWLRSGTLYLN